MHAQRRESRAMRIRRKITIFSPPLATTILVRPMTFDSEWLKIFAVFTSCIVRLCTLLYLSWCFQHKSLHSYCFRKLYKQETQSDCQKVFISFIQKLDRRVKRNSPSQFKVFKNEIKSTSLSRKAVCMFPDCYVLDRVSILLYLSVPIKLWPAPWPQSEYTF